MKDVQVGSQVLSPWNIIFLFMLSVFFLNLSNCQHRRPKFRDSIWTLEWRDDFALLTPFQLYDNVSTKFTDIENFTDCDCPRVYYPTCGTDEVTYVNPCIVRCYQKTMKRFGPCLLFRRANVREVMVPEVWKINNTIRRNVKSEMTIPDSEDGGLYAII